MTLSKRILLVMATTLLITSCNAFLSTLDSNSNGVQSGISAQINSIIECRNLCVFNISLEGLDYKETSEILLTHPLTYDAKFTFLDDKISWQWSKRAEQHLLSEGFTSLSYYDDINYVRFNDDIVSDMRIAIGYSLRDLLHIMGSKFQVYPYSDTGRAGTIYLLEFPDTKVRFLVRHRCEQSNFAENTFVVSYMYSANHVPYYWNNDSVSIEWKGYKTKIQDCSTFLPG